MGNRTSFSFPSTSLSYNANNLNQYTAIFAPDGSATTPQYDANGNMLQFQCSTGFQPVLLSLQYNDENRLVSVSPALPVSGSLKSEFLYDFMGRRRIKKVFSYDGSNWQQISEHRFVYKGFKQIAELDASDTLTKSYTWNGETLLQVSQHNGTTAPQNFFPNF